MNSNSSTIRGGLLTSWKDDSHWEAWRSMPRMASKSIPRTKFWLLKAPMSTVYEERFGGGRYQFQVNMFIQRMTSKGVPIEMVVDCTALDHCVFHHRMSDGNFDELRLCTPTIKDVKYMHNHADWEQWDVNYVRLMPPEKEDMSGDVSSDPKSKNGMANYVPSEAMVREFNKVVSNHWVSRPKTYIAIFDSQGGLGAASFLASSYMITRMKAPVHVAIASVRDAMPDGIFDFHLLEALQRRYQGKKDILVPSQPKWLASTKAKNDVDNDKFGSIILPNKKSKPPLHQPTEHSIDSEMPPPPKKFRTNHQLPLLSLQISNPLFVRALTVLKQLTAGHIKDETWPFFKRSKLKRQDIEQDSFLEKHFLTWRSRGRRGLLLLLSDGSFFIERNPNNKGEVIISQAPGIWIPSPTNSKKCQHRTLIDGILVDDVEAGANRRESTNTKRYLIFDVLCFEGGILTQKPFTSRVKYIQDGIVGARKRAETGGFLPKHANNDIKIRAKDHFDSLQVNFVLKSVLPKVLHKVDGLVFVPKNKPYFSMNVFEWTLKLSVESCDESTVHESDFIKLTRKE